MSVIDNIINEFDIALKTLSNKKSGTSRSYPAEDSPENLTQEEKDLSIQLMRVNLAGEVAAQALYRGQAMVCEDDEVKEHLINAGLEETDHLIWCKKRLDELGGNGSLLNPIWYAGSFALGAIFGSLGKHLDKISQEDKKTIKILETMRADEDQHANEASESGGEELKDYTKKLMSMTAKVMTSTSAHI